MRTSLKGLFVVLLATLSFSAFACGGDPCCGCAGAGYVGNPDRPNTIFVEGHYRGCHWIEGYYVKYLCPPVCKKELCKAYRGKYDRLDCWGCEGAWYYGPRHGACMSSCHHVRY